MTFLELAQALMQEAAVNGDLQTVTGQSGELKRCVDWTKRAWLDIQGRKKWSFLWEQASIVVPAGYNALATDLPADRWDINATWRLDPAGIAQARNLDYLPWTSFSMDCRVLAQADQMSAWSVRPDNVFVLNSPTSVNTTFSVERWKNPQTLVDDDDVPLLPDDLHYLIVWTAMKKYAGYDEAGNQRAIALDEMRDMTGALYTRCLPRFTMGGGLLDNYNA